MLQAHAEDDCCAVSLSNALASLETADTWSCPKCGAEWRPRIVGEGAGAVRLWEPHVYCAVW